jgi:hypothetical protein
VVIVMGRRNAVDLAGVNVCLRPGQMFAPAEAASHKRTPREQLAAAQTN